MFAIRFQMAAASLLLFSGIVSAQGYLHEHAGGHPQLSSPIINHAHPSDAQWQHAVGEHEVESHGDHAHGAHAHGAHANGAHANGAHAHGADAHGVESGAESTHAGCQCGTKHCHGVCLDPGHPAKPRREKPGDVDRGDCPPKRYRMPDCKRAGNPHCVAPWAKCSVSDKYSSWFVGGGAAFFRGRCRKPTEGTWGLDYNGFFGHANVWLNYTRGRKQGGEGAYQTDGEPEFVSKAHSILGLGH